MGSKRAPEGVYTCTEAEAIFVFGSSNRRRRQLALRVRRWVELGRQVGAAHLLLDGSFVTAKEEPHDVDTVILLPQTFSQLVEQEYPPAPLQPLDPACHRVSGD
jgi:hypothetical protein